MNKGTGSGGTNTTHNGIAYEKLTSNETMLLSEGYIKECDYLKKVFENKTILFFTQNQLKTYFKKTGFVILYYVLNNIYKSILYFCISYCPN